MTQGECSDKFLTCIFILLRKDSHWIGCTDTLISRTTITHHWYQSTTHTSITGRSGLRNNVREDAITKDSATQRTVHYLTQTMSVVSFQRLSCSTEIITFRLKDKLNLIDRSGCCKLPYRIEVQTKGYFFDSSCAGLHLIEQNSTVLLFKNNIRMGTHDDSCGTMSLSLTSNFYV